jgi:hypothetical protein
MSNSDNRKKYSKWNEIEDKKLLVIVDWIGYKWKFISRLFPDKTVYQVYNRYFSIDPDMKKGKFSKEEDSKLNSLVNTHGLNWRKIQKEFKNRSAKQLRSRYNNFLSKEYDESEMTEEEKQIIFSNYPILGNKWTDYMKILPKKRSTTQIRKVFFKKD